MKRTRLRLDHEMPFNGLSKLFPDAHISRWCNLQVDILEITLPKNGDLARIEKGIRSMLGSLSAKLINISHHSERSLEVVMKCRCAINNSSVSIIEASNCIPVMPVIYKGGYEFCEILAFNNKDLNKALDNLSKISKVQIESHGKIFRPTARSSLTISVEDFFGELTQKQLYALVQSIEMGYYSDPKDKTIAEIASLLGISPSTFEEHLKKAEIKLMRAIIPYARLARSLSTEPDDTHVPLRSKIKA